MFSTEKGCLAMFICGDQVQSSYIGCNTGNGEKLSISQARCLAQLFLAAA